MCLQYELEVQVRSSSLELRSVTCGVSSDYFRKPFFLNTYLKGRELIKDKPPSGRPLTTKNDENINRVRDLVQSVHEKNLRKFLSQDQKYNGSDKRLDFLKQIENNHSFLECIITGDESWIFKYDPETKRQSQEWHTSASLRQTKSTCLSRTPAGGPERCIHRDDGSKDPKSDSRAQQVVGRAGLSTAGWPGTREFQQRRRWPNVERRGNGRWRSAIGQVGYGAYKGRIRKWRDSITDNETSSEAIGQRVGCGAGETNLDQGNAAMFPIFTGQKNSNPEVLGTIRSHLQASQMSLKYYFPDLNVKQYDWVHNPFTSLVQTDDCELQQEAVELKNDRTLQLKFKEVSLNSFGMSDKYANWLSTAVDGSKYGIVLFWAHFTTTDNATVTGRSSRHNYTNSTRVVLVFSFFFCRNENGRINRTKSDHQNLACNTT
ncbi:Hypothetical protein CINCED_3A018684 [Cinara cedri]|uniref:Uncharacterized protein n=1 Tax=Cinara cedri TaxID=506608 RepID=A0A5E4NG57_9HEMI|nr:Hypothetical protein CINCED_3A018684 [Cinara cedri]